LRCIKPIISFLPTLTGGDLRVVSMPGYGVDAFLSLKRLEDNVSWREPDVEILIAQQPAQVLAS